MTLILTNTFYFSADIEKLGKNAEKRMKEVAILVEEFTEDSIYAGNDEDDIRVEVVPMSN